MENSPRNTIHQGKDIYQYFFQIYIDGTKLEANANKYSWVWKKATEKSQYRLFGKITSLLDEINEELCWSGLHIETKYGICAGAAERNPYIVRQSEPTG